MKNSLQYIIFNFYLIIKMTSWIVNYVINKYLSNILEVDSSLTDASILNDGQIEFGKVKIKQEFLNSLNMPFFEFKETFIGKLTAKIYYSLIKFDLHFENYPIYIVLDEVYILIKQKGMNDWSEERKIKEMENYKNFKLQEFEEAYKQYIMNMAEKTQSDLVKKILHNLNILITNVVIRFEDDISNSSNPYSLGLIIEQVICKPVNEKFDVIGKEDIPYSDINNKILSLKGFSVFLDIKNLEQKNSFIEIPCEAQKKVNDSKKSYLKSSFEYYCYCQNELIEKSKDQNSHNYLIYNLDLTLKLSLNQNIKKNIKPALYVDLLVNRTNLKIKILQIKTIIKLLNIIKLHAIAQTGMESYYYIKKLSDQDKLYYSKIYINYFEERYFKNSKEDIYIELVNKMQEIQKQVRFNEIQAMRNAAYIRLEHIKKLNEYDSKLEELKPGVLSFFISQATLDLISSLKVERDKLITNEDAISNIMEQEMNNIKIKEKDSYEGIDKFKYIVNDFKITLKKIKFEIKEESTKELVTMNFWDFETHVLQGLASLQIYLFLGDFFINQYKLNETVFNKIIESHQDGEREPVFGEDKLGNEYEKYYENKKGALSIGFEMNSDPSLVSNYRIRIRNTKRLYVYANLFSLKFIGFIIGEAVKSEINLSEISKYATEEAYKHIKTGYSNVNKILSGEYRHFNISADLVIQGPIVIVPQNIIDKNNIKCLMLSFGEFGIKSILAPKKDQILDYKTIKNEKILYDTYEIKIYGFELLTIDEFKGVGEIKTIKKLNIIDKVDFNFILSQIIEPKNEFMQNFKIVIQLKNISFQIRDKQIEFLMYFLKHLGEMDSKLAEEIKKYSKPLSEKKCQEISQEKIAEEIHKLGEEKLNNTLIIDQSTAEQNIKNAANKKIDDKAPQSSKKNFQKCFMKFQFIILKINIKILKSIEKDEMKLLENNDNKCLDEHKEYLSYLLNNFLLLVDMKEDLYIEINTKILNFFLIDKDYVWKLDPNGIITQYPVLNDEFQIILGTLNSEIVNDNIFSRSMSMKIEAEEDGNIMDVYQNLDKLPFFMDVNVKQDTPNKKTFANVTLRKFILTINFSTYKRLMNFIEKIKGYSSILSTSTTQEVGNNILIQSAMLKKKKTTKIKEKLDLIQSKKDEYVHRGVNKKFMPKLLERLRSRKNKLKENNLNYESDQKNLNTDIMSVGEKSIASKRLSIMEDNLDNYRREYVRKKLKISFEMQQIELNIPLDAEKEKTKAIVFNFNTSIRLKQITESDCYYEKSSNNLVIQNYYKKNLFVNLMLYSIDLDMYSVVNNQVIFNLLNNKILSNLRISVFLKSFLNIQNKSEVMSLDIKVEPISMIIGFRQIRIVKDFLEIMRTSLNNLPENQEIIYFDKSRNDLEPLALNQETNRVELTDNEFIDNKKLFEVEEDNKSKISDDVNEALSKKINKIDKKIEQQVKYNITFFNKLNDVNIILEKASIKLIDNTGDCEKILTMIDLSKISLKMISNTNPYDVDNMREALLEMLCDKKPRKLNISNLYMYLDMFLSLEIASFNERVSDWEPILEPWSGNFKIVHIDKCTRKSFEFNSDIMMNFNLSIQSIDVLNNILTKINQTEADWKAEKLHQKANLIDLSEIMDKKNITEMKNRGDVALLFENRSGVDITFYFIAEEKIKFNLNNNFQKSFNKNALLSVYSNLTDEIILQKRDKFSFFLNDYPLLIEDIDYSYNHYLLKRIPIIKSEKLNPLNNIKTENNNYKNIVEIAEENKSMNMKDGYIPLPSYDQEENDEEKFVEICIKIKNNGLVKVISFESNFSIYNNSSFPTKFCFIKKKKYSLNQIYSNNTLDLSKCEETIECNTHSSIEIPLKFLIEPYFIFLGISFEKDNSEIYKLLFNNLKSIYSIGGEYNKIVNEYDLNDDIDKKAEITEKFTLEKCMQIKYENQSKISILSIDLLMLKSKNYLVTSLEKEENKNNAKLDNLFYYEIIINPPLVFENKAPYDVNINYNYPDIEEQNKLGINLDVNESSSTKIFDGSVFILPLEKYKIYNFDFHEKSVDLIFNLNYQNKFKYSSKKLNSKDLCNDKNLTTLYYQNNDNDYFEMICERTLLTTNRFYDHNYLEVEQYFSQSRIFLCYFEYILINRLEEQVLIFPNNLELNDQNVKEETKIIESLNCYNLTSKSLNLFSTPRHNSKAKIKILNSEWSQEFEMAAHGLEAGNSVEIPDPKNHFNKLHYEFAIKITSSNNFNYSTVIIIEPRHVIVNKTGLDLKFRQVFEKGNFARETQLILNDTQKVLKLNKYENENLQKNIQFFINTGFFDDEDISNDLWSQAINIDNLQEYNLEIYLPKYFDFKKYSKLDPEKNKNIYSYDDHSKLFLIRVTIQTLDNGLIYIILNEPKFPQFLVKNSTKEIVKIKQKGTNFPYRISPGITIPFTLRDLQLADLEKIIEIEIFNKKTILSLDTVEETNELELDMEVDLKNSLTFESFKNNRFSNDIFTSPLNIEETLKNEIKNEYFDKDDKPKIFFSVSTDNKNITRIININTNFDEEDGLANAKQEIVSKKMKSSVVNFSLNIEGIGISIIDSFPREVFYVSFYNLSVVLRNYVSQKNLVISRYANYLINLKNFQIDCCLDDSFNQIIYPKNQYIPFNLNRVNKKEHVNFLKLMITKAHSTNIQNYSETEKIAQVQFILQEFNVKIDQQVINVLLHLTNQLLNRLDFYKINSKKKVNYNDIENENDDEEVFLIKQENQDNNFDLNIDPNKYALSNDPSRSMSISENKRFSFKYRCSQRRHSDIEKFLPEESMSVNICNYEDVLKKSDNSEIYNISKFFLGAIKINLTLRIDISSLEISLVPAFIIKLLGTVGNAIARITDSPLSFSEIIMSNIYNNMNYIIAFIFGKYKSQGILQFYKIIGSSDLIGNPVGLVNKVGTGFIEFFNEPRKGFVDGPIQFGTGVARGVNSLVSNVVGGGLDAVGKITGTLYNATKNLQGEKGATIEEEEPTNVLSGAVDGVKGGVSELAKGIAGIFVNPYNSAKKEGVKGFFKGVGKGLIGAVISPFSAVLKVGNSLAIGMKNTATFFSRSKIKTDRFRHPRNINQSEALKPFDNDLAETQAIISNLIKKSEGKAVNTFPKIVFTKDFTYGKKGYMDNLSTVIITDYYLLVVYNGEEKIFDIDLKNIWKTEVHRNNSDYVVIIFTKDDQKEYIFSSELGVICQIHGLLQKLT